MRFVVAVRRLVRADLNSAIRLDLSRSGGRFHVGRRHRCMIHMDHGLRSLDLAGRGLGMGAARHRWVGAEVLGQGFARTMESAILDRRLDCGEARLARIVHDRCRAGDRIYGHAADARDAPQLFFDSACAQDRKQVAYFEGASRHVCLLLFSIRSAAKRLMMVNVGYSAWHGIRARLFALC